MKVRVALLVLVVACSGDRDRERDRAAATPPAPERAGRHPDADGAARACVRTHRQAMDVDPAERVPFVLRGCKQLFFESGCQEAHTRAETAPPTNKMALLVAGCRDAYCPLLPVPRPRACDSGARTAAHAVGDWLELQAAILDLELGHERAARLSDDIAAAQRTAVQVKVPPAPPAAPIAGPRPIEVAIRDQRVYVDGIALVDVALIAAGHLERLTETLHRLSASGDRDEVELVIGADRPYADVIHLMDAIKAAGVDKMALIEV